MSENATDYPQGMTERRCDENSPNVFNCRDDCIGKQHGDWLPLVATAGAANATGFAVTAATTADTGSGEIVREQINDVRLLSSFSFGRTPSFEAD